MPDNCIVCGLTKEQNPEISLFRIPKNTQIRNAWLKGLCLIPQDIKNVSRVCSLHFRDGNSKNIPSACLGKRFCQLPSKCTPRGKRQTSRDLRKQLDSLSSTNPSEPYHSSSSLLPPNTVAGSSNSHSPPDTEQPGVDTSNSHSPPDTEQPGVHTSNSHSPPDTEQPGVHTSNSHSPPDTEQPDVHTSNSHSPPDTEQPDVHTSNPHSPSDTEQPDVHTSNSHSPPDTEQPDVHTSNSHSPPDTEQPGVDTSNSHSPPDTEQPGVDTSSVSVSLLSAEPSIAGSSSSPLPPDTGSSSTVLTPASLSLPGPSRSTYYADTDSSFTMSENESACSSYFGCDTPHSLQSQPLSPMDFQVSVNVALISQIEMLKADNKKLKQQLAEAKQAPFRLECIATSDSLISLYTGFSSYEVLLTFFKFLGPAVNNLQYWGTKPKTRVRRRMKLNPLNQLFMTLVKLRLDLNTRDLAVRFQISKSTISRYFITWVCFLYHELKEIPWFPSKEQVAGTLPYAFRERYPTTIAIIDASEIFVETPSDLMLQSTAWSNYKHHNTFKFLVACTPNGAISFISSLYLGSVSDPMLTQECGFIKKLDNMSGVAVMADRGFTIKETLSKIGVDLNLPPFMEGRGQLPVDEMQRGRSIAALRIHVERAIGRIKQHKILTGVFPLKMARIANQIVTICAYLSNFHPALVPVPTTPSESEDGMSETSEIERELSDSDDSE